MKSLCIVDTCSLINLSAVEDRIGNKKIFDWLWDEFEVKYSSAVLNEINRHRRKISGRRRFESFVWPNRLEDCEVKLFGKTLQRNVEGSRCYKCGQERMCKQDFAVDLRSDDDRGERHNCCLAINALREYSQVIFLTDDYKAVRDYAEQLFELIPLGSIWSSLDFVVYLFVKHRNRISLDETLSILRSINAQFGYDSLKIASRLTKYNNKVTKIQELLS